MNAASPMAVSYEDYLLAETAGEEKHEWSDGVVYAMSRGTPEHARLSLRAGRLLGNALAKDCEVYSSDLMIFVEEARLSTYADATVVCGPLDTKKVVKNGKAIGEAVTNPTVIVEVLSDSTERYDRDGKFNAYRKLASFEEYVLVSQYERLVEVYRRDPSGAWSVEVSRAGASFTVHGARIAVDDLYG